jgi:hypothetical protein
VSPGGYLRPAEIGGSGRPGKRTPTRLGGKQTQHKTKGRVFGPPLCTLQADFRVDAPDFGLFPQSYRGTYCRCRAVGRINLASLYALNAAQDQEAASE